MPAMGRAGWQGPARGRGGCGSRCCGTRGCRCRRCRRCWRRRGGAGGRGGHRGGRFRRGGLAGVAREQVPDQVQLGPQRVGVGGVQLQGLVVGLAGELRVDVAQVLVGRGVARVGADRHLEGRARLVELVLVRVEHGQVVVGLGQLGVILGELGERRHRIRLLARIRLRHAAQEAQLGIARIGQEALVRLGQRFLALAGLEQLGDLCIVVSVGQRRPQQGRQHQQSQEMGEWAAGLRHGWWQRV